MFFRCLLSFYYVIIIIFTESCYFKMWVLVSAKRVFCTRNRIFLFYIFYIFTCSMFLPLKNKYTLVLLGYIRLQPALTTHFSGKIPVCDLKTGSYSLSRMHVFTTQTNPSRGLKMVKYFCKDFLLQVLVWYKTFKYKIKC